MGDRGVPALPLFPQPVNRAMNCTLRGGRREEANKSLDRVAVSGP